MNLIHILFTVLPPHIRGQFRKILQISAALGHPHPNSGCIGIKDIRQITAGITPGRQHQDNAVIAKLRHNKPLTPEDVKELEKILWSELGTREEYDAEYDGKPLGEFVREIVGLDMNAAKEAFAEFLDETSLDSAQIYFVNQIVEYIVHNGLMKDLSVLREPPFTDNGSIVEVFTDLTCGSESSGLLSRSIPTQLLHKHKEELFCNSFFPIFRDMVTENLLYHGYTVRKKEMCLWIRFMM